MKTLIATLLLVLSMGAHAQRFSSVPHVGGGFWYYDSQLRPIGTSFRRHDGGLDYHFHPPNRFDYGIGYGTPAPKMPRTQPKRKGWAYTDWDHKYW